MMRLIGLPQVPRGSWPSRGSPSRASRASDGELPGGWCQKNWHIKNIFTSVHGGHTIKMGGELRRMYGSAINTTNYIPAYQFFSIHNFAVDAARQMNRYVDPRTGQPADGVSVLMQNEWALFWTTTGKCATSCRSTPGCATRTTARSTTRTTPSVT